MGEDSSVFGEKGLNFWQKFALFFVFKQRKNCIEEIIRIIAKHFNRQNKN